MKNVNGMALATAEEVAQSDPNDFYLRFSFEFGPGFLGGRKLTKSEMLLELRKEASHNKNNHFLAAFLSHAADHIELEIALQNNGDEDAPIIYRPDYRICKTCISMAGGDGRLCLWDFTPATCEAC